MGLKNQGVLHKSVLGGVLGQSSVLAPTSTSRKREVHADLLLTALIDAFSILVIFLLMSFSSSGEILVPSKGMQLPKASMADPMDKQPVVKVEGGQIYVEGQAVPDQNGLVAALVALRQNFAKAHPGQEFSGMITILGDRRLKYSVLNSIVLASSQAGFSDMKFAVLAN